MAANPPLVNQIGELRDEMAELVQTGVDNARILEQVVVDGDLSKLTTNDRLSYYKKVCESLGLNPFTKPFAYIRLNGKLTLYALRDATDQLRSIHGVSVTECVPDTSVEGIYMVRAKVKNRDGRSDEATGAVTIQGLTGDALCNAIMKAETKAKRRATLSVCGLGWLDETETETIGGATGAMGTREVSGRPVPPILGESGKLGGAAVLSPHSDTPVAAAIPIPSVPGVQSTGASRHPLGVFPDAVPSDATQGSSSETGLDPHIIEPEMILPDPHTDLVHPVTGKSVEVGEVMPAVPSAMLSSGPKAPSPTLAPSGAGGPTAIDKLEAVMAVHRMTTGEVKALSRAVCHAPYGTLTKKQRDTLAEYIIERRGT